MRSITVTAIGDGGVHVIHFFTSIVNIFCYYFKYLFVFIYGNRGVARIFQGGGGGSQCVTHKVIIDCYVGGLAVFYRKQENRKVNFLGG